MCTNLESLNRKKSSAFTLLEVMLAMAILALLTATLFTVVQGSLKATSEIMEKQRRAAQISGFLQLWKQIFYLLPAKAVLKGNHGESLRLNVPILIIQDAPHLFSWLGGQKTIILTIRPRVEGGFDISVINPTPAQVRLMNEGSTDFNKIPTVPLLTNLSSVKWRFFDPRNGWVDEWANNTLWPKAVELIFSMTDERESVRSVILLPQLSHVAPPTFQVQTGS